MRRTIVALALSGMLAATALAQSPTPPGGTGNTGTGLVPCGEGGVHLCSKANSATVANCGTSPTVTGNSESGRVVPGSGATQCTITFGTAWGLAPACIVAGESNSVSWTRGTTSIQITALVASAAIAWHCFGQPNGG